jgi:hypothetical protein
VAEDRGALVPSAAHIEIVFRFYAKSQRSFVSIQLRAALRAGKKFGGLPDRWGAYPLPRRLGKPVAHRGIFWGHIAVLNSKEDFNSNFRLILRNRPGATSSQFANPLTSAQLSRLSPQANPREMLVGRIIEGERRGVRSPSNRAAEVKFAS